MVGAGARSEARRAVRRGTPAVELSTCVHCEGKKMIMHNNECILHV